MRRARRGTARADAAGRAGDAGRTSGSAARRRVHRRRPLRACGAGRRGPAMTMRELMAEAIRARDRAYAPYSRFPVGAALLLEDGSIFHGSNVENASYGLTACAERTAMWKAVSEGRFGFVAIAITARDGEGAPPCGACRQVLHEFAPHLRVVWRDARGRLLERPLHELLPNAFRFAGGNRRGRR